MARELCRLFDGNRPTRETRIGPDRLFCREYGSVEELIPDRQREAEVDVLWSVQLVVDPVKVGADEDPSEWPEAQVGVRVSESDDPAVDGEHGYGQRTVGQEHDSRDQRNEVGNMNQGMGTKDRQHTHVLL